MKKLYYLAILLFLTLKISAQSYSPPSYAEINNDFRNYVNNVFGLLEATRVPTGLLMDYAFDFSDPTIYNGTVLVDSTLMEQGLYNDLYKTIFTSRFNNNISLRHPRQHDSLCFAARQKEVITLSGLLFKYNTIDPNAQQNGTLQTINGQLKDVYNNTVWQNPYEEKKTIAISPSVINYNLTYCSVLLPSNLFLSNMLSDVSSVEFDADDGNGYRALTFDVPINLSYADTGWKHWTFRVTLSGSGQQLYSHSKVYFNNTSNEAGSGGIAARGRADGHKLIVATQSYNGLHGAALVVISYRNTNDRVLRKPLIIAEGLDPGFFTSPEEPEGATTFRDFIDKVEKSNNTDLKNMIIGDPLVTGQPSEYDIVYVNWINGTDWLQRNAYVLEEVIRWVNNNKQPLNGNVEANVVIGNSMGGVIARMALGNMDRNGGFSAHQTKLYVSIDASHRGASMPLGFLAAARHATRTYIASGPVIIGTAEAVQLIGGNSSLMGALSLIDQPAPKQLLINRLDIGYNLDNSTHLSFMNELKTQWAHPAGIRKIAISNGSECAIDQEFLPGSSLLYHTRMTKSRFLGDLFLMMAAPAIEASNPTPIRFLPLLVPGANKFELTLDVKALANNGGNQVYYGNVKFTKKVVWLVSVTTTIANKVYNAPSGLLAYDTYPGGFFEVAIENQPGSASRDWAFNYDNSFFIQRRFSFAPIPSALDIGNGNLTFTDADYTRAYVGGNPPASPYNSPFDNFITAYHQAPFLVKVIKKKTGEEVGSFYSAGNEPHVRFYERNAQWLVDELNRTLPTDPIPQADCSFACNIVYTISGDNSFCTTSNLYTIPNLPAGSTVTWSVTPAGAVTINSPGASQTTLSIVNGGVITLTASITNACTTEPIIISKENITVGPPTPVTALRKTVIRGCFDRAPAFRYTTVGGLGATNYNWYRRILPATSFTLIQSGPQNFVDIGIALAPNQCKDIEVKVEATNACNQSSPVSFSMISDHCRCAGAARQVTVSPNPVTNLVKIEAFENDEPSMIQEVEIYDKLGFLKKKVTVRKNKALISLNELPSDTYYIRVFDGKKWTGSTIIKR